MNEFDKLYSHICETQVTESREALRAMLAAGLLSAAAPHFTSAKQATPTELVRTEPRGFRNNNPGNIEKTKDNWKGMVGSDGRFIKFKTKEHGVRAMARILKNYQSKYKDRTLRDIINRWAPPSENPTDKYVKYVATKAGISSDTPIDLAKDASVLFDIIDAMIMFENGKALDAKVILRGIKMERSA